MESRGVYTLGPECIDPLLARKMALTWAHKAQHGLTMPQESFNAAPGWPQEAVLKAWKRTLAPRLRFEWGRDGH